MSSPAALTYLSLLLLLYYSSSWWCLSDEWRLNNLKYTNFGSWDSLCGGAGNVIDSLMATLSKDPIVVIDYKPKTGCCRLCFVCC